jgi:DNA-binding LacI/PurR family transcriptional regulator
MDKIRVRQVDIANKLGISQSAVGLALRNHPRISLKRREEVKRVAEELGFRPDPYLAGLSAYRQQKKAADFQGVIGWINHWNEPLNLRKYGEFEAYWRGASATAQRLGYKVEEIQWSEGCSVKRVERILTAQGIQGVLIPPHQNNTDFDKLDWDKFSLIRFGMSVNRPDSNLVTSDQHRAMLMAVTKVNEYGYKRIGLMTDPDFEKKLGGNYYGAFCWAQKLLKLDPALPPHFTRNEIFCADPKKELQSLNGWVSKYHPDAILTPCNHVPEMIKNLGYKIPEDIAIAGTSVLDLSLDSGIDQHSEGIGKIAVEMLIKQIYANERGEPLDACRILVESTWRDGKSLPRHRRS